MADKRPVTQANEEQSEQEKASQKKEKQSHADLLKKGIAERVTSFLSTAAGKKSLEKGKDFFVQQFLASRESSDANALAAYKAIIGKKAHEELSLDDLADITISYDTTFQTYIEGAEKEQFTAVQEKAIAHAFLEKMHKVLQSKHFQSQHRDAWNQYVYALKDGIHDRADLDKYLKTFFKTAGVSLSDDQRKHLNGVSIEFRDVASYMTEKAGFEKEAADKLDKKALIAANTDAEDMVKRFLREYAKTEIAPAYQNYQGMTKEMTAIYHVPGFQRVLEGFDLSAPTLAQHDKAFAAIYNDAAIPYEKKKEAQQRAIVAAIALKDKPLAELVAQLFAHQFNLARVDKKQQQLYVDRFQDMRTNSKEMKTFDELFTKIGADIADRKDLMRQIFNLSSNELTIKGKNGQKHVLQLKKHIIDRPWSAESLSETMTHALPIAFVLTPNADLDAAYAQRLAKVTDKAFTLNDAAGNPQKVFPGHLVEISLADGKKHTGYIYKDPEGNIMLSKQPGSTDRIMIEAETMKTASARIVEPTYTLKPEDVPVLLTHIALLKETNERSEETNREAIAERNNDLAQEVITAPSPDDDVQFSADADISRINREDPVAVAAIDDDRAKELRRTINERLASNSIRSNKLDTQIRNQEKQIENIDKELAQRPLSPEQMSRLQARLMKANAKKEDLIDQKEELDADTKRLQLAQKQLQEKLQAADAVNGTSILNENVDTEQAFLRAWAELNGDKTLTIPEAGKSCIMALLPDATSSLPGGGGAWMRGDIIGFDESTQTMQIRWHGVEGALTSSKGDSMEGTVTTVQGADGLQELKRKVSKLYKFKKYRSVSQRGIDLKGGVDAGGDFPSGTESHFHFDKRYEGRRKHLKDDIDFPNMKQQRTGNAIKYFGKKGSDSRAWFAVETHGDTVEVKELTLEGKDEKTLKSGFSKSMPANDFMMFAMEKDLRGYTQEEVDTANAGDNGKPYIADRIDPSKQPDVRYGRGLFNMKWGSIAGVMSSRDIVKKGVKNYFDEKSKKGKTAVENAMLTSSWFKGLEKLPYLGEAFEDIRGGIDSKLDKEKKDKIGEFKDEVDKKKAPDSNGSSRFILLGLEDVATARKEPLKAAGYYLYALQEGGNPYFRALKEKQGTGWRVERILGPDYVPKYKAYIANIEAELKKDPYNEDLKTALYKDELGFMTTMWRTDEAQLKPIFGSRFFTGGLGVAYNTLYNGQGISKTYEGDDKHKSFGELHADSWPGFFEAFRVNDYIAYSKLLSERVGMSDVNYYKRAGFILMPLMNGQSRKYMNNAYQYEMVKIAKKAAFPFAGYMTEGNGMEKLQQLFDTISDGSLTKTIEEVSADDTNKNLPEITKRTKAFQKWREANGRTAIDRLQNPKELFSLKKELEPQLDDQQKVNQYNTLTDYINHKFNDEDRNNISETYGGDSIIYQKNIFSAPSGFVKEQMLNFSNAQFKGKAEKSGPELWEALKGKLTDIQNIPEGQMSKDFFVFLLKRYLSMFHSKYTSTSAKKTFVAALKYPNIPTVMQINVRGVFDKKLRGDDLPGEVTDTLIIFEEMFRKYAGIIKSNPEVLGEIFDDPRMVDYYLSATAEHTLAQTNDKKQIMNERKKQMQAGVFDDEDDYRYSQAA